MIRMIVGYILILCLAFLMSNNKREIIAKNCRVIFLGILLQIILCFSMVNIPSITNFFERFADGIMILKDATLEGTKFVFGFLGGGDVPFDITNKNSLFIFAFQALPTVILVSILSAILTYLKILPFISKIVGSFFRIIFRVNNYVGMISAAKILLGQFEAPLLVKHKLPDINRKGILIMLSLAFSTSSASLMPIYASAISRVCPNSMRHMIMSSVICVISTLIISSIIMDDNKDDDPLYDDDKNSLSERPYNSFFDAVMKGTQDGSNIWWSVVGYLIGMISLMTIINYVLGTLPFEDKISLQKIFGFIMYPIAWISGIDNDDINIVSGILGTKIVVNETVAFFEMAKTSISNHSAIICVYLMNNFGNLACLGMTMGGLIAMCPSQKKNISELGMKSFITGLLATILSAIIMNIFI